MLALILNLLLFAFRSDAHSWLSCPSSFDTNPVRGGFFNGPCENWNKGGLTSIKAGSRLKVGWTSNNHAGGYVRLALVPEGQEKSHASFKNNVLKMACYGFDLRPGKTLYGDCIHPCNARPGCKYQADKDDVERYDTTITIPFNLKDGYYVLQWVSLVGNIKQPYYSCARLRVWGGDSALKCASNDPVPMYKCKRSGGPPVDSLIAGIKRGDFCYHPDRVGHIDDRITEVPINVDCDARITCDNSIDKPECFKADGMSNIKDGWNPKQTGCGDVAPPPPPSCRDGVQNQGEEDIDCGGPNCSPCPTYPPGQGKYYSKIEHKTTKKWYGGFLAKVEIHITKDVRGKWVLTIQYDSPADIASIWDAVIMEKNSGGTIYKFIAPSWASSPRKGDVLSFGYEARKMGNEKVPVPVTILFKVEGGDMNDGGDTDGDFSGGNKGVSGETFRVRRSSGECRDGVCPPGTSCEEVMSFPCKTYPCNKTMQCV